MNTDVNKRLVERFYDEVWARGNLDFAEQVFATDYTRHDLRPAQAAPGPAGQARIAEKFRRAFPDLQWRIDLILGDGDLVAARWTASGTHSGRWADVQPTGKRAEFSGVNIFRFNTDGRVAEIWNHRDDLGLMEQLGAPIYAGASTEHGRAQRDDEEPQQRGPGRMTDRDEFLEWIGTTLYEAELALHNGDAAPRRALWSRNEPVGVLGAWRNAHGRRELDELFAALEQSFSDCTSFEFELQAHDMLGDLAYTAGLEHTSASVDGEPRSYTLRVTQVYRREDGEWKVAHRHGDTVTELKEG